MSTFGYRGKTVLVYGLGKSGRSVAQALVEDGTNVLLWDDDMEAIWSSPIEGATSCELENLNWEDVATVIKSPGIPMDNPLIYKAKIMGVPIISDIDLLFRREKNTEFIGITGTNGKSTTTALVGHLLEKAGYDVAIGGNFGVPALSLPSLENGGIYVLEISSFQLEIMNEYVFDEAAILNITPDHLDRHGAMDSYLTTKMRIFERQDPTAMRVISIDDDLLENIAKALSEVDVPLTTCAVKGKDAGVTVDEESWLTTGGDKLIHLNEYQTLPGRHNWQNIAVAYALLKNRLTIEQFKAGLKSFVSLPHRMEVICKLENTTFINDSKATNAHATIPALKSFKNIYWIVGGVLKEDGITPCLEHLSNVRAAFVIGDTVDEIENELKDNVVTFRCSTMDVAVREAFNAARREGLDNARVLLSPACASYDQFSDFVHRGDVFASLCHTLEPEGMVVVNG